MLGQAVTECSADGVVYGGKRLQAKTLIWAAGVRASPAAEWLGAPADRAGRLQVLPDLTVPGHPDIFAVGDTVHDRRPGRKAGARALRPRPSSRDVMSPHRSRRGFAATNAAPFRYSHAGSLAQIGKRKAVIDFGTHQAARHAGLVDLGHRPHLFPDRPAQPAQRRHQLALDLRPRPARGAADHTRLAARWDADGAATDACPQNRQPRRAKARRRSRGNSISNS